jgi:hypothetical protein
VLVSVSVGVGVFEGVNVYVAVATGVAAFGSGTTQPLFNVTELPLKSDTKTWPG